MFVSLPPLDTIRTSPTYQRPDLLERAWALPVARLYVPLLSQSIRSMCGPTSVANVLRSMQVRTGKNPAAGSFGFKGHEPRGNSWCRDLSAEEVVPDGWAVGAVRPRTVDELRAELRTSNDVRRRTVANFSRAPLFGGGGGHHSPVGGFLENEDLAFVLDVNAGFGPWLVSTERLFEAISTVADRSTGLTRGLAQFVRSA